MSTNIDCYEYAVGLSQTDCACFDDNKPSYFNTSDSELFLDELEGINLVYPAGAADCGRGNLWELMQKAHDEGIRSWRNMVMAYISQRAIRRRKYFSGVIGSDRTDGTGETITKDFAGLTFKTARVRGGKIKLKRIGVFFKTNSDVSVALYDNTSDTPIASYTITPTANQVTWYEIPNGGIELPLAREISGLYQYWLVYQVSTSPTPMKHSITCGCGELSRVNKWESSPSFINLSTPEQQYNWLDWMVISGTTGDAITDRDDDWSHENYAHGLLVDAEFICNANEILCVDALDYQNDSLAMAQAYGLRYAQGEKLVDLILSTTAISRVTMLDREALYGKRSHYKKQADEHAQWVAQELTSAERINEINDCFACKAPHGFSQGRIMITNG